MIVNLVHNRDTLKGRPRVLRTVKPLFNLPSGSTLRSLRELVEFLKLACLYLGLGTAYYRAACKEGPYQDRPLLCPFRLSPLLTCS